MAYRSRRAPARRSPRRSARSGSRRNYSRAASPRRSSARRSGGGGSRTVRIVIEQPGTSTIARPELVGKMPVVGLTRTRSRF